MFSKAIHSGKKQFFLESMEKSIQYGLLEEVHTTPKPGLVDGHDSGAHWDMDLPLFEKSAAAITPYLTQMAAYGLEFSGDLSQLFPGVRLIGRNAEAAMFQATGGVNTHKGILFILGILVSVIGWEQRQAKKEEMYLTAESVFSDVRTAVGPWLKRELEEMKRRPPKTHGELLYRRYGIKGIRGEAMKGFPSLEFTALPIMEEALRSQPDTTAARLKLLLSLMARVEDTNVWTRGGRTALLDMRRQAAEFLNRFPVLEKTAYRELERMNRDFIRKNISPGGCADLLAAALFFQHLSVLWKKGGQTS